MWRWYFFIVGIKLGLGWIGFYKVIIKIIDVIYRIKKIFESLCIIVYVDYLRLYEGVVLLLSWVLEVIFFEELMLDNGIVLVEIEFSEDEEVLLYFNVEFSLVIKRFRVGRIIKFRDIYLF